MEKLNKKPPKWPLKLLGWFCKPYYLEIIEGDLIEMFEREVESNRQKARLKFTWNVICFFRLRYIKNIEEIIPKSSFGMFKNHFKVTLRSMRKNASYTSLNIMGLAIGIASCLLIIVHVSFQLTYDKFIPDVDRVYRVLNDYGGGSTGSWTPAPMVKQMREDFPEIESGTRVSAGLFEQVIKLNQDFYTQGGSLSADSTFFEVFPTQFISGQSADALNKPNSMVLTESLVKKFFPNEEPVGQFLIADNTTYTITAVVQDPPKNSSIPYELIMSFPNEDWITSGSWTGNNFYSYLKLKEHVDFDGLSNKFPEFVRKYIAPELMQYLAGYDTWDDYLAEGNFISYQLIPMKDIHLHYPWLSLGKAGSYTNVITFSLIAFFILLIGCINYINMSTARSSLRIKEVGMRKVIGALRLSIIQQFLMESLMICIVAVIMGLCISIFILPYFNYLTDMSYDWTHIINWKNILWLIAIIIVTGLLAGSYPAFYLSSIKPIAALRGAVLSGGSGKLRTGLVIFQFAISTFLIASTIVVYQQINHMSKRNLGINADQVFVIKNSDKAKENYQAFRNELLSNPLIVSVGAMNCYPSGRIGDWNYQTTGENPVVIGPDHVFTDEFAMQTIGFNLAEGNFFSGIATDTGSVVVNQTFVKKAGLKHPVGAILNRSQTENFRIIGVIEDAILGKGGRKIRPVLFRYEKNSGQLPYLHIAISGDYQASRELIEQTWGKFVTDYPFDGFFLNDSFDRLYNAERRFGQIFSTFSGLAILIASIGLFALAAFTLERRMKELAIRKVLGASIFNIMNRVIWDFLKLILVGSLLSIPIVVYLGNDWLNNFSYRIAIDASIILLPVLAVALLSICVIGLKSYKTASDNPVNSLKVE